MVNAVTDIQEDTLVEIVISAQQLGEEDIEIRPHSLSVHSYKTPTFCHFCGELLMGLFKQVLLFCTFTLMTSKSAQKILLYFYADDIKIRPKIRFVLLC